MYVPINMSSWSAVIRLDLQSVVGDICAAQIKKLSVAYCFRDESGPRRLFEGCP